MADVITRFKLETTQYDSKLRDASKGLSEFVKQAEIGGKGFTNFSQKSIEAARALGTVASGATSLKDKVKDLVGAYNDAAKAYNKLSQEQQQSDFGKALAGSINQLSDRIKEAKSELYSLGDAAQQTSGKMQGVLGAVVGGRGGMVGNIAAQLGATKTQLLGISAAVAGASAAFKLLQDNVGTALNFEKSMSQLSSLTGMVGADLEKLKGYAIELGSSTTLSASQVADAFKMIGSQQPQLLASGEALKQVTKYAITLSEAAGIELSTAAQTLSTSINQMGGDSDNAARYINVLAAASQKGAGDIAWLGEALTKSATAAKAVGTDYEELVANLEQLAKAGFDASTSGTALRSIIMNLEKQANNEFKPSIVGLTQAFQNLADAHLTISGYQDIVGKMFATQAMALASAAGEAKNMTVAITGTNTAEEQAKTNTDNLDGSLKSLASAWEGLNLHLNASNGYLRTVVDWLKDVVVWADKAVVGLGEVTGNRNQLNNEGGGGNTRVDRQINTLSNTNINRRQAIYSQQVEKYWRFINDWEKKLKEAENRTDVFAWETIKKNNDIAKAKDNIAGAKSMLSEYQQRAGGLLKQSGGSIGGETKTTINVDADTEEAKKSIKELQAEIKKLKALRDDAASTGDIEMRDQYNSQIKSIEAQIKAMRGGGTTGTTKPQKTLEQENNEQIQKLTQEYIKATDERRKAIEAEIKGLQQRNEEIKKLTDIAQGKVAPEGSLNALNEELKKLQTERGKLTDPIEIEIQDQQIKEVQDEIDRLNGKKVTVDIEANIPDLRTPFERLQDSIKLELSAKNVDVDKNTLKSLTEVVTKYDIQTGAVDMSKVLAQTEQLTQAGMSAGEAYSKALENAIAQTFDLSTIQQRIGEEIDIPDETWKKLQDEINAKLAEMNIEPINIDFNTGKLKSINKTADETAKEFQAASQAITSMGAAMSSIEDPTAKVMGMVAQAIASVAMAFGQSLKSSATVWDFIAGAAAGLATMVTTISAIHSATGYANGGEIKGNSYSGDNILAQGPNGLIGLNAGEVVLNASQQNMLANNLQGNGGDGGYRPSHISGEQIWIAMNRYTKRTGRGELVTWK